MVGVGAAAVSGMMVWLPVGAVLLERAETVLLSRPRSPAWAKYYPPSDLLNCEGANFSDDWRAFRLQVEENHRAGFPRDQGLWENAKRIYDEWHEGSTAGSMQQVHVLLRQAEVSSLRGFCLFGFAVALFILFRHDFDSTKLFEIQRLLGWEEWPLDFMESSSWPTLWRIVPLHLEEAERTGATSWSASFEAWGSEKLFIERPHVEDVRSALDQWLGAPTKHAEPMWWALVHGAPPEIRANLATSWGGRPVRVWVAGHHLGSSMEPFTMLRRSFRMDFGLEVDARFYGQRHPAPNIVCLEFGYCHKNDAMHGWFRRYENLYLGFYDWMADQWPSALEELAAAIKSDTFLRQAEVLICGGPGWLCSMLRSVRPAPMMLYFAWALVPMVPVELKPWFLWQLQALGSVMSPPTIFVAANWILAAQFALQVRLSVPVMRPHGLYMNQTYAPVPAPSGQARVMVSRLGQWTRTGGPALLEMFWNFIRQRQTETGRHYPFELVFLSIRVRGIQPIFHATYAEMAQFHSCVFWPWDVMMLLFDELYTMTMPLLVPEHHWMHNIMLHTLKYTEMNWWHLRADTVRGILPTSSPEVYPLPFEPWIDKGGKLAEAAWWYELTDFAQFPHLTRFSSVPDMLDKIQELDVNEVRAGMRLFNRQTLRQSSAFYQGAAVSLLGSAANAAAEETANSVE